MAWRFLSQKVAEQFKCFSQSSFNSHVPNLMEQLNVTKAPGGTNFYGSQGVLQFIKKENSCATTFNVDITEAEAAELVYLEQFDLFTSWLITNPSIRSFDKFVSICDEDPNLIAQLKVLVSDVSFPFLPCLFSLTYPSTPPPVPLQTDPTWV